MSFEHDEFSPNPEQLPGSAVLFMVADKKFTEVRDTIDHAVVEELKANGQADEGATVDDLRAHRIGTQDGSETEMGWTRVTDSTPPIGVELGDSIDAVSLFDTFIIREGSSYLTQVRLFSDGSPFVYDADLRITEDPLYFLYVPAEGRPALVQSSNAEAHLQSTDTGLVAAVTAIKQDSPELIHELTDETSRALAIVLAQAEVPVNVRSNYDLARIPSESLSNTPQLNDDTGGQSTDIR